jgi:adenylate cyclase
VAGWSLGLFVFLVTLSALSFRRSVIALTVLAASLCEGFLQRVADVGWGAVVSSGIVLALSGGTMAWILARFEVLIASRTKQ